MKKYLKPLIIVLVAVIAIGGGLLIYNKLSSLDDIENGAETDVAAAESTHAVNGEQTSGVQAQMPTVFTDDINFTAYTPDGKEVKLSDIFEDKPMIVNFWASWCGPCKSEMPYFEEAYKKYGDDITFVMVDLNGYQNDTKENAEKLIDEMGYTFPVYFDSGGNAMDIYGVRSMPTTYFFNARGEILTYHVGAIAEDSLNDAIQQMLGR
ncbi:MAG: TlpA family protein disulfide reductase [Clostridiales bacterium]|nr:TlpA family protein disulfide reductase [Clostridiales bacterium]